MFYLANSSMRFAIRRLSSGQRSFKPIRLLALLGSENTWVNKYYKGFIDIHSNSVWFILIELRTKMAHKMK